MDNESIVDTVSLEEFCKSIGFIAPEGTQISFFIAPKTESEKSIENTLTEQDLNLVDDIIPAPTSTTVYLKKDLDKIQNDGSGHISPVSFMAQPVENRPKILKMSDDPIMTYGGKIAPAVKSLRLSDNSLVIQESIGQFPKGTIVVLR